ncbi:unnamed protein product [Closterium sp. NIES-53]
MATWLHTTQLQHILSSPYVGVTCDESTDRCRGNHRIIYISFIKETRLVTEFLALLTVDKCDAASLLAVFLSHLQALGIELGRIAGISTDGAGVMLGVKNGLVARLRSCIPHLVSSHCIAHREVLAAKNAAEALPEFDMVDNLIRALAEHLGRSSPWHQRFYALQEVFTASNLELQGIHSVHWLSRGDVVLRLVDVFPAVIVMLSEYDLQMYELATSYRFYFLLFFIADVLEQLNVLNKTFQHREVSMCILSLIGLMH